MATPRVLRKLGWLAALLLTVVSYSLPDAARAEFNFARYKETDLDDSWPGGGLRAASTSTRCYR